MATQNAINLTASGVVTYNGAGTFSASTFSQFSYLVGGTANSITGLGPATNGQLLIGSTGGTPVLASLTAGSNITITPGAGSITIAATGGGSGALPYTVVTGGSQAAAVNHGYISNNAGGVVAFTLPATSAVGDIIRIVGANSANGWTLAYSTGQSVLYSSSTSTITSGTLASTNAGDCIDLVCFVANTTWIVQDSIGNITVT